jgi:hypothetical protein
MPKKDKKKKKKKQEVQKKKPENKPGPIVHFLTMYGLFGGVYAICLLVTNLLVANIIFSILLVFQAGSMIKQKDNKNKKETKNHHAILVGKAMAIVAIPVMGMLIAMHPLMLLFLAALLATVFVKDGKYISAAQALPKNKKEKTVLKCVVGFLAVCLIFQIFALGGFTGIFCGLSAVIFTAQMLI